MGVCGNVCCVAAVVKNSVFFSLGVLKYVVCLCRGCDGCCVFSGVEVVFICNLMRIGRWSELSIYRVCQDHEVMREVDANETSGELGSALGGILVGLSQLSIP